MIVKATAYPNRQILVYSMGPVWIHAVELGTLRSIKMVRAEEDHLTGMDSTPETLRRARIRLEKKSKAYRKFGCRHYNPKVIRSIIEELRA